MDAKVVAIDNDNYKNNHYGGGCNNDHDNKLIEISYEVIIEIFIYLFIVFINL